MFKKSIFIIFITLTLSNLTKIKADESIVFVDLNFIFFNSIAGKDINEKIVSKKKKIKSDFDQFQKKIDKEKNDLTAKKNVLAENEYQKKILKLENDVKEYNSIIAKNDKELQDFKNKARIEFAKLMQKILEEYSKKNSISMIVKKENILMGKNELDATSTVLDLFNESIKKIKIQ